MKFLIVNGDDFGASRGINRGILEAHESGILTSTSLLVDAPGSAEAAVLLREAPELSVGLHADLERSALDANGVRAALEGQLRRFEELVGASPTHVDSHHNVHRDPALLPGFLAFARAHGLPLREHSPVRYFSRFYGQWGGRAHLEHIGVASLARMLASEIGEGITELSCHPGYAEAEHASGYAAERETELRTLCDPTLRDVLAACSITLAGYRDLGRLLESASA